VDKQLAGVSVSVGDVQAIPLYVSSQQINAILPFSLATSGQTNIQVKYNGVISESLSIPLTPTDIQIFTADASGSGPGSILNQDGSVNTSANPAAAGTVISVYCAGAGMVSPAVTEGLVAGLKLSWVTAPYSATVNGEDAKVLYAGTAPELLFGVYQFNVQLPADVQSGQAKVVLHVGNSTSQPDVTVFVK